MRVMEDSPFRTDSIMHNPKTGGKTHTKQAAINDKTLAHAEHLCSDREITHFSYRLSQNPRTGTRARADDFAFNYRKMRDTLMLHFQFSGFTFQTCEQISLYFLEQRDHKVTHGLWNNTAGFKVLISRRLLHIFVPEQVGTDSCI